MKESPSPGTPPVGAGGAFPATQWAQVAEAMDGESPSAMEAMDSLARAYWPPLYSLARQSGLGHEESADAVQEFLARLLTREGMRQVERRETLFRSFLGKAFRNWLSNERRRNRAEKRGGSVAMFSLDAFDSLRGHSPDEADTPEQAFDRRWARAVYDQAMARLCAEQEAAGKPEYCELMREMAFGGKGQGSLDEIAGRIGMNGAAFRKALSSLRARFGKLLRKEVERIVSAPSEVDSELRYLLQLLTKP